MINDNYEEKYNLEEELEKAYRKLKSYSYYENKNVYLKKRIIEFEKKFNYEPDKMFKELANDINNNNLKKYLDNENFKIRFLPKDIKYNEENNIVLNYRNKFNISKIIHFVDISVEAQIIGVLWILYIGYELEKTYKKNNAGNRLDKKAKENGIRLFKPYYMEYQRWRDDAINIVDKRSDEKKRTLMLSLDIKEYYYSTNIDFHNKLKEKIEEILYKNEQCIEKNKTIKTINNFVEEVIKKYSNEIRDNKMNMLPIGFLPSYILANWYLSEFDEKIIKEINPLYYKRYVDDMIIVLNGEYMQYSRYNKSNSRYKKSNIEEMLIYNLFCDKDILVPAIMLSNQIKNNDNKTIYRLNCEEDIYRLLLVIPREEINLKKDIIDELIDILEEIHKKESIINELKKSNYGIIYKDWGRGNSKKLFKQLFQDKEFVKQLKNNRFRNISINSENIKKIFLMEDYLKRDSYIVIQDEKIKIYDFKGNGSKAIIENFKKELRENASVFKFLPEKTEILESFDSEVYKIDYKNNIHKLSNIDKVDINSYDLSKFLARIIYSDKLENSEYVNDVDEKISWIFKGPTTIQYYFLWSKVFNYYLLNSKYEYIKEIIINIYRVLEQIYVETDKYSLNKLKYTDDENKFKIQESLKEYLRIVLSMKYALNDELFIDEINKQGNSCFDKSIEEDIKQRIQASFKCNDIQVHEIYTMKENFRCSNMLEHNLIRQPLMNYNYLNMRKVYNIERVTINYMKDYTELTDRISDVKCYKLNSNFSNMYNEIFEYNEKLNKKSKCKKCTQCKEENECEEYIETYDCGSCKICKNDIDPFSKRFSPRFVHLHECIIYSIQCLMAKGEIILSGKEIEEGLKLFNSINKVKHTYNNYLKAKINGTSKELMDTHFRYFDKSDYIFVQKESKINYIEVNNRDKKDKLKIAIINMNVEDDNLIDSFKKTTNLSENRLENFNKLLNYSVKKGAEMIIFPEVSVPVQWLGLVSNFAIKHDVAIICGLEHIIYENGICCNYLATILPDNNDEYNYSIIKLRLKNHYSPNEKEWVRGYMWKMPFKLNSWQKEYDLFRWKGIDFSTFSCFELANIKDRSLFISYVDLLIGSVHNKDVNYYSNIMESLSRDVHCYFAHVNSSKMGDNRIIKPASTNEKNILQITGGLNDTALIGEIDIKSLRDFQCLAHNMQIKDKRFKPVPPEFNHNNVKIRSNLPL